MSSQRRSTWAGLAAVVGGLTAVVLTPLFATAYFLAYPGYDAPLFWYPVIEDQLDSLLVFSSSTNVYNTYGRIYNLVYVLFLPAAVVLHQLHRPHQLHRGSDNRQEKRGFRVLMVGLIAVAVGVAGDYWANGMGFPIEVLGLLVLAIGSTMYGIALLRSGVVPRWWAWLLVASGPGALGSTFLIGHLPSGPTLPFAISWVVVGFMLMLNRGIRAPLIVQPPGQGDPRS